MQNNAICVNQEMPIQILEAISNAMSSGMQKSALEAVADWIQNNFYDDVTCLSKEEREARIRELLTKMRDGMTDDERKTEAAWYLEGVA